MAGKGFLEHKLYVIIHMYNNQHEDYVLIVGTNIRMAIAVCIAHITHSRGKRGASCV